MSVFYQLFDLRSGNLVGEFASERDAWAALRQIGKEHGPAELHGLGLVQMDGEEVSLVAMEEELVRLAMKVEDTSGLDRSEPVNSPQPTTRDLAGTARRRGMLDDNDR